MTAVASAVPDGFASDSAAAAAAAVPVPDPAISSEAAAPPAVSALPRADAGDGALVQPNVDGAKHRRKRNSTSEATAANKKS